MTVAAILVMASCASSIQALQLVQFAQRERTQMQVVPLYAPPARQEATRLPMHPLALIAVQGITAVLLNLNIVWSVRQVRSPAHRRPLPANIAM